MNRKLTSASRTEIASSAEFRAFVEEQSREAQRRRDDRMAIVEAKRQEIARSLADHNSFALRTDNEIADLLDLVADDDELLDAVQRMFAPRPSPQLTPHTEVGDALGGEK